MILSKQVNTVTWKANVHRSMSHVSRPGQNISQTRAVCFAVCDMCLSLRQDRTENKKALVDDLFTVLIRASSVLIDKIVFMDVIRDLKCVNVQC